MTTGMVHREAFEAVGGMDDSLRTGEDYDLWLRLAERFQAAYVPRPLCHYRMHAGGEVMGDVDRWIRSVDLIHSRVLARNPNDTVVRDAIELNHAAIRLSRAQDRLLLGDREGARQDLREAAQRPEYRETARKLLRHARLPTAVYLGLRRVRDRLSSGSSGEPR